MQNHMELTFDSISQNESFARAVAAAFATQLNPTLAELSDIRTAISEAVTNAIVHGYGNNGTKKVRMLCEIRGDVFEATVIDEGKGMENVSLVHYRCFKYISPNLTAHIYFFRSVVAVSMNYGVCDRLAYCRTNVRKLSKSRVQLRSKRSSHRPRKGFVLRYAVKC